MPITKESLEQLGQRPPTMEEVLQQQREVDAPRLEREAAERAEAEAKRVADAAEAEAEAERARVVEVEHGEAVREAGTTAVTELLLSEGNALQSAVTQAKAALDAAKANPDVDDHGLFVLFSDLRLASARYTSLVGEGRRLVSIGRGTSIPQMTDALDTVSFASILDEAIALRIAPDRARYQARVYEVSEAATSAAIAKGDKATTRKKKA